MSRDLKDRLSKREHHDTELQQSGDDDRSEEVWVREQSQLRQGGSLAAAADGEEQLGVGGDAKRDRPSTT